MSLIPFQTAMRNGIITVRLPILEWETRSSRLSMQKGPWRWSLAMPSISSYSIVLRAMEDGMPIAVRSMALVVMVRVTVCQDFAAVCAHPACAEAVLCHASSVFDDKKFDKTGCKRKKGACGPSFYSLHFSCSLFEERNLLDKSILI